MQGHPKKYFRYKVNKRIGTVTKKVARDRVRMSRMLEHRACRHLGLEPTFQKDQACTTSAELHPISMWFLRQCVIHLPALFKAITQTTATSTTRADITKIPSSTVYDVCEFHPHEWKFSDSCTSGALEDPLIGSKLHPNTKIRIHISGRQRQLFLLLYRSTGLRHSLQLLPVQSVAII